MTTATGSKGFSQVTEEVLSNSPIIAGWRASYAHISFGIAPSGAALIFARAWLVQRREAVEPRLLADARLLQEELALAGYPADVEWQYLWVWGHDCWNLRIVQPQ